MRCHNCNVDLPEEYSRCPLCGGKASPDAPLIEGIRIAEYPKVKTQPAEKNHFMIFLVIWAVCSLIPFIFSVQLGASVFCLVPFVWTLVFRPLYIKQLYAGNFIVMNLLPMWLASLVFSSIYYSSAIPALLGYMPLCCFPVLAALLVLIFAKPKTAKRAAAYPVLIGAASVIGFIVCLFKSDTLPLLWLGVTVLCACMLALLFVLYPTATKEELKAKFSIQKSVSKIKQGE